GQRIAVPSVRVTASRTPFLRMELGVFRQMMDARAAASGMKALAPPSEFTAQKHTLFRADFLQDAGSARLYFSEIETTVGEYLLTIEVYANSQKELDQAAASLQSATFSED